MFRPLVFFKYRIKKCAMFLTWSSSSITWRRPGDETFFSVPYIVSSPSQAVTKCFRPVLYCRCHMAAILTCIIMASCAMLVYLWVAIEHKSSDVRPLSSHCTECHRDGPLPREIGHNLLTPLPPPCCKRKLEGEKRVCVCVSVIDR